MATIDERIVKMSFDNQGFETGVNETMSSLEKLKKALSFKKAETPTMDLSGIAAGIDQLNNKFSAMGIAGMTVMQNITNSAIEMGKRLASAISVDALRQGFSEYELQMDSVKTINASTGESIGTINKYLDELNTYADQTIYSFSDMTRNIGKFTNAGVKLKDAVSAIQGISNEAALSGANSAEASRAMYNFAQALSAGYVKLIDWKSIENANMATVEFKTQLLEAAVAAGTVEKTSTGMYKVLTTNMQGKLMPELIDATHHFNDSLAHQWMTTEVLTKTLKNYADETTEIGKKAFAAAKEVTTFSKLIETVKEALGSSWTKTWQLVIGDFNEAKDLWTKVANAINGVIDPISDARNEMLKFWHDNGGRDKLIEGLTNAWNGLKQVLGTIRDAFRTVFPPMTGKTLVAFTENFRKLTQHFKLSESQVKSLRVIFTGLFSVLKIVLRIITGIVDKIKSSNIGTVLQKIGGVIVKITEYIADFITGLSYSQNMLKYFGDNIGDLFKNVFKVIGEALHIDAGSGVANVFSTIGSAFGLVKEVIVGAFDFISYAASKLKETFIDVKDWIVDAFGAMNIKLPNLSEAFDHAADAVSNFFSKFKKNKSNDGPENFEEHITIFDRIRGVLSGIAGFFRGIATKIGDSKVFQTIKGAFSSIIDFFKNLGNHSNTAEKSVDSVKKPLSGFADFLGKVGNKLKEVAPKIKEALPQIFSYLSSGDFKGLLENLLLILRGGILLKIRKFFSMLTDNDGPLAKLKETVSKITKGIQDLSGTITAVKDGITKSFDALADKINGREKDLGKTLIKIAVAIGIVAVAIYALSKIEPEKLVTGIGALVVIIAVLITTFKKMQELMADPTFSPQAMNAMLGNMLKLALGIGLLTIAFKSLASLEWSDILQGLVGLAGIFAILLASLFALSKINKDKNGASLEQLSSNLIVLSIGIGILAMSVKSLGKLDPERLLGGLLGILTIIASLVWFAKSYNSDGLSDEAMKSILMTVGALVIMALVAKTFAKMTWEEFAKGLASVLVLLMAVSKFTSSVNLTGMDKKAAKAIAAVTLVLITLAKVAIKFSTLSWEELARGLVGVAGVLVVLLIAINNLSKVEFKEDSVGKIVAAMLALSLVIGILAGITSALGSLSWEQLAKGLIGIGVAVAAITIPLMLLSNSLTSVVAAGQAIALMALGMLMLFPVLKGFASMGAGEIVKSLLGLAGALVVLGLAGAVFGAPVLTTMIKAGAIAIALLGAACVVAGIGVVFISAGILALSVALAAFAELMGEKGPEVVDAVKQAVVGIAVAIAEGIIAFAATIIEGAGVIAEAIATMILAILDALTRTLPEVVLFGVKFIIALLEGIVQSMGAIVKVAADIIIMFLNAIGTYLPAIADAGVQMITSLINGLADGIRNNVPKLFAALRNLLSAIIELILTMLQDLLGMIPVVGDDIRDAFEDAKLEVRKAIAPESLEQYAEEAIGENGLAGGIASQEGAVEDASAGIGDSVINGIASTMTDGFDIGSDFGVDISNGMISTESLLGDSALGMGESITDNLDIDMSDYGNLLGEDYANNIGLSQGDIAKATDGLTGGILDSLGDANGDFSDAGYSNIDSYFASFTNYGTQTDAKQSGEALSDKAVTGVNSNEREFKEAGENSAKGYADGMSSKSSLQYVETSANKVADTSLDAMKKRTDQRSPSKKAMKIGAFVGEGFALGIVKMINTTKKVAGNLGETALDGMRNAITTISDFANAPEITDPMIRPVLDLTNIQNGVGLMNSMFGTPTVGLRASLAGTGATVQGLYDAAGAMNATANQDNGILGEMVALREDVKNLGNAMAQMKMYMDGKEVGGIVSSEVDRKLGLRYLRNKREGRA